MTRRVKPADQDGPILIEDERALTLAQLEQAASQAATALEARGIGPNDRVVVASPNRIEWFVLNRAIGKLGAFQVAMNARLTPDEAGYIAKDSGARAAFVDMAPAADVVQSLLSAGVDFVATIDGPAPVGAISLEEFTRVVDGTRTWPRAGETGLIIYTSGTTGKPKGAVRHFPDIPVHVLREYVASTQFEDVPRTDDPALRRVLVNMPLSHASGPKQATEALEVGTPVILQRRFDAEGTLALIERYRITDWYAVPTMIVRILALPADIRQRYDVSSLRRLRVGGAPCPPEIIADAFAFFGDDVFFIGYGSTEAGMVTGIRPWELKERPASCGRPYAHVEVEVRDGSGQTVLPTGATGDIWARTPRVIAGYLDKGPLPSELLDARGFFNMGDIGWLDVDGYLFITDRRSDMIISGGINIYPAEVEAYLRRHEAVRDAAVFGIPDDEMGERILAVVELNDGTAPSESELLGHCSDGLARYKRPVAIVIADELPRNSLGKVQKGELREPYWHGRTINI